jgi:hypothetical protein
VAQGVFELFNALPGGPADGDPTLVIPRGIKSDAGAGDGTDADSGFFKDDDASLLNPGSDPDLLA